MRTDREAAILLWLAIALAPAKGQVALDESGKKGTLEIVVVDSFGDPVEGATLHIQRLGGGEAFSRIRIDRIPVEALEYGLYRLTAERSGFEPASRVVGIHDPLSTVVVALVPGEIENDGSVTDVRGQLKDPGLSTECSWIRLIPLFGSGEPLDAKVYKGQFVVANAKPGKYAAVLFGQPRVCRLSTVDIKLGRTQSIVVP